MGCERFARSCTLEDTMDSRWMAVITAGMGTAGAVALAAGGCAYAAMWPGSPRLSATGTRAARSLRVTLVSTLGLTIL